jgi:diguanylate cyclase (GGDEF)-like protein
VTSPVEADLIRPPDETGAESLKAFSKKRELLLSFLWLFMPVSLLLGGIFFAFSNQTQKFELQTALIREESALHSASQLTSLIFVQKLSDLFVLAEGEVLKNYLHDKSLKNWIRVAREFALFARRKPQYMQLRYLDGQGKEVVRINNRYGEQQIVPRNQLQDKSSRYYFKEVIKLDQGAIYISPLDLNVEKGVIELPAKPTVRFATPVVDGYGVTRGVLIINYDPAEFLQRIKEILTSRLGHAVMLNSDGYWLLGKPEEQLWGFMYGKQETFESEHPDVWSAMGSSDKGSFYTDDGLFVFQKTYPLDLSRQGTLENLQFKDLPEQAPRPIGGRYWIYVSHISKDKIDDLSLKRILVASVTYLLLFIVTAVISLFFARNAVQKKLAYQQLKQYATTDALTGLANRRELDKVGMREFRRAQRFDRQLSVMMLDLDHFKAINDTYNHTMGDEVLCHVVSILNEFIRGQDILFRYGGEEFLLLLPESHEKGAKQLASRICTIVADSAYENEHLRIPVTISIGVSAIHDDDESFQDILVRADQALYQAKRSGRNRVVVYDESITHINSVD